MVVAPSLLLTALESGLDFVKVADDELAAAGFATGIERDELVTGLDALESAGASAMLVSRGDDPALARADARPSRSVIRT